MQFCSSAVQIVGRLFGILTMASGGGGRALTGTTPFPSSAVTLALASVLAVALAVATVLAAVCFCSLSSFSSISRSCFFSAAISASAELAVSRSCFFSAAISASAELADCALTCHPTNVMIVASAIFVLCVAKDIKAPSLQLGFELRRKKRTFVHAKDDRRRPARTLG